MQTMRRLIALALIQVFLLSVAIDTMSPEVSATLNDADIEASNPDFSELQSEEDVGSDSLDVLDDPESIFVPGEVLVKFRHSVTMRFVDGSWTLGNRLIDALIKRFRVRLITRVAAASMHLSNVYKLKAPEEMDVLYMAEQFSKFKDLVEYAEPNGVYSPFLVPNDANYTQQWAHQVIESEYAWNVTTGDSVVIAIVDTGVDYNHPDLAANIWINTDEIPDNGIDDDQNGFVDDVRGWDFVEAPPPVYEGEDGTQPDNDPMDFLGHGTTCAGIAAAVGNNGIGIAGVTWNSKIMAVRSGFAATGGGVLLFDQSAAGVCYAADNGADIISMSFGGNYRSKVVYDAIRHAYDNGVLLIGAAGNEAERTKSFPAAYEEVVAVTATDQFDSPAYFTNFGSWVDVAAPGVDILSATSPNSTIGPYKFDYPYDYVSGTSAAAPHVAGIAALILSRFPTMTRDQVTAQLLRTAVDLLPEGFDTYYGYGRVNASGAANLVPTQYDLLVFNWRLPLVSAPEDEEAAAFYPSGGSLLGSTQYVSGSLGSLQSDDGVRMTLRSYASAKAVQTLYGHQEPTVIGGVTYYQNRLESADASGTSLSVSIASTGRMLWGQFVSQLIGVSSLPSGIWTIYYRTWFSAGGVAHADVDILIRRSDGTVRTTIATDAAGSSSLTTTPQTLSGTYNFPDYTVVDQTDYLEIDCYCDVTTKKSAESAYLRIDDYALPPANQTRADIYLPSQFAVEAEFTGSSNAEDWAQLVWTVDSRFSAENVTATFQLYNYTANAFSTIGDGYMADTLGTTEMTMTQTVTANAKHFRNATGDWKIKAKGVKSTSSQFDWQVDLVKYEATWSLCFVDTTVLNFGSEIMTGINVKLLVNGTEKDSERISELQSGESAKVRCSWTPDVEGRYNFTTYVEPRNEPSNVTDNNAQSAYSWVSYDKAVKVPHDFSSILEAIETSNLGIYGGAATILVSSGTYYEYDLLIQGLLTSLTLAGENRSNTVISGDPSYLGVWSNVDNVTVEGFTIQSLSVGVVVWSGNCMIRGNILSNNNYGVHVTRYYNNTIRDNIISENSQYGMRIALSSGDQIINNTVSSNGYGLYLSSANKTSIDNNTFTNNNYGIWLASSSDNVFTNNTLTGNTYGFGVGGHSLSSFLHDIDTTNTVEGKPIYYLISQSNVIIDPSTFPNAGYIGLVNSTSVTVKDLNLSKNGQGVMFAWSKDSTLMNITASSNRYGISFFNCNNTFITSNVVTGNYYGVYTSTSTNNTISNNILENDYYAIEVSVSSSNDIRNNTVTDTYRGIGVYSSNSDFLEDNIVTNGTYGVYLYSCDNSVLTNRVTNSTYGLYIYNCENSVLTNNNLTKNTYNFFVYGLLLEEYMHNIDDSNTINGKPVYYLINQANLVIDPVAYPSIGYLGLVNSVNITVKDISPLTNNGQGILCANVTYSSIENLNASNNYYGIHLLYSNSSFFAGNRLSNSVNGFRLVNSYNNTIDENTVTNISREGIYLDSCSSNWISDNSITEVDREGIYLKSSDDNTISGNTVSKCGRAGYYSGIVLSSSGNNTIDDNEISRNDYGVKLDTDGDNTISSNSITYNTYGIYLWHCELGNIVRCNLIANNTAEGIRLVASSDNVMYHNNLMGNKRHIYNSVSYNSWDSEAEGNYWSGYTGQDLNGDGVGDTAYVIDASNRDSYPLMKKWGIYALNLRVKDWDLTDSIQDAYVYVDSDLKVSDAHGWANWSQIGDRNVYVRLRWYGAWVNGTFLVVVDSTKTIDVQCKIFDVVVTTVEIYQSAGLQNVNVTVCNATGSMIRTGTTGSDGKAYLTNVPNSTLTFTCYEGGSPQQVIANVTRTITIESQAETIICDQNYVSASQEWNIITDNGLFSLSFAPLPAFSISWYLRMNSRCLKERVKKIRSKQSQKRERKEVKPKNEWPT